MTIPTGHQTITKGEGAKWRAAREGDIYIDSFGRHWECRGTFIQPAPKNETETLWQTWKGGPGAPAPVHNTFKRSECDACTTDSMHWKQERGIPADVPVKYETSYTKKVVDGLVALGAHRNTFPAIRAAIDLPKDYHGSLHAPYEQRDKARQDLVVAQAQLAQADGSLRLFKKRYAWRLEHLEKQIARWTTDLESKT